MQNQTASTSVMERAHKENILKAIKLFPVSLSKRSGDLWGSVAVMRTEHLLD